MSLCPTGLKGNHAHAARHTSDGALLRLRFMTPTPAAAEPALEAFLRAIPKVELHCHLFGTVRHATFAALNRRAGSPPRRSRRGTPS